MVWSNLYHGNSVCHKAEIHHILTVESIVYGILECVSLYNILVHNQRNKMPPSFPYSRPILDQWRRRRKEWSIFSYRWDFQPKALPSPSPWFRSVDPEEGRHLNFDDGRPSKWSVHRISAKKCDIILWFHVINIHPFGNLFLFLPYIVGAAVLVPMTFTFRFHQCQFQTQ